jgi:hypothetical protein
VIDLIPTAFGDDLTLSGHDDIENRFQGGLVEIERYMSLFAQDGSGLAGRDDLLSLAVVTTDIGLGALVLDSDDDALFDFRRSTDSGDGCRGAVSLSSL